MAELPEVTRLKVLAAMPLAELRSRENALPELLGAVSAVMPLLSDLEATNTRETSAEVASLAGLILETEVAEIGPASKKGTRMSLQTFHSYAQRVAGSALSQRADAVDPNQPALPLEDASTRALVDAQVHGQALPLERTVVVGPDSTGPKSGEQE